MMNRILLFLLVVSAVFALPDRMSWGSQGTRNYLGAVLNQNNPHRCESAWAIATTNVLSARINIAMDLVHFNSPLVSLSPQSLLECDSLNFGCLGVRIILVRDNQARHYVGYCEIISQTLVAIHTELKGIQMESDVLQKADVRHVGLKTAARLRVNRRCMVLRIW